MMGIFEQISTEKGFAANKMRNRKRWRLDLLIGYLAVYVPTGRSTIATERNMLQE